MKKYVAKFGEKYLRDSSRVNNTIAVITLTDDLFKAQQIDRYCYDTLKELIDSGADIKGVTTFETSENWDIEAELEELAQDEKRDQEKQ